MLRAGLFWKLLIATTALSVVTIVALSVTLVRGYRIQLERDLNVRLDSAATAASELLDVDWSAGPSQALQNRVFQFGRRADVRLTLIRADGVVLADSDRDDLEAVLEMEPHDTRPEVIEAGRSGSGIITRRSPTLGIDFRYQAYRIDDDGQKLGTVRAALPLELINAKIRAVRRYVWAAGACVALAAVAATYWLASRITEPMRSLTAEAEALAAGDYDQRISVVPSAGDDMSVLARALNELAARLAERERQLIATNQTQATVLEGMTECVIAVDAEQRIMFANAAAERSLGFNARQASGRGLVEVVRNHDLRDLAREALAEKNLSRCEMAWHGDRRREFEVLAAPLPGNPCPGAVIVLRDVSDLKRLEGLRQQFVSNVSHELKTPLSSIKAYTETLLSGAFRNPEHCEHFLKRIDEQADRLHQLIVDMLHLARIESGQAALEIVDVSASRVVERCFGDYDQHAEAAQITLSNEVDPSAPKVRADEEGLRLILSNLIDNAIKYTPAGGQILLRSRCEGDVTVIDVVDTGIGVAEVHQERLFERFFRVDKARSSELGGTGLGLSIVKHLVQAMGGRVSVESKLDHGSTFSLSLPTSKT